MDQILEWDVAPDPDQVPSLGADPLRQCGHFSANLRRVWIAGDDHQLVARIHFESRGQKQLQAFLPRDPAVEKRVRRARVDTQASERLL